MSLIIHNKYKYFDSTVQGAEDKRQKFHFRRLPFAVNVMLNLSNGGYFSDTFIFLTDNIYKLYQITDLRGDASLSLLIL